MARNERTHQQVREGPGTEQYRKRKVPLSPHDQLKTLDSDVIPFNDYIIEPSVVRHAALLADIDSDEQRADIVMQLQQYLGNFHVQRVISLIQAKKDKAQPEDQRDIAGILPVFSEEGEVDALVEDKEIYSASLAEGLATPKDSVIAPTHGAGEVIEERIGLETAIEPEHNVKRKVITEPFGKETNPTHNGHVDYWIDHAVSIEKKKENGKRYKVSIVKLDLHTKIYIWPPTHPRWKKIEDFEPYSDQPFLAVKFATYQGTMLHEQQHVKELIEAWNQCYPKFVADVNAIYTRRKKKAEKEYSKLFAKLEKDVDAEYHKHGEVKAEQIEWEYYRAEYEKHVLKLVEAAIGTP